MSVRHRSRSYSLVGGTATWTYVGSIPDQGSYYTTSESCDDTYGQFDSVNPFYLERTVNAGWTISGKKNRRWDYGGYVRRIVIPAHASVAVDIPSDNMAVSRAAAWTNPNRADIDLPVFLAELRDLPLNIMDAVRKVAKRTPKARVNPKRVDKQAAGDYLSYQFGLLPVISDIRKMLDFQRLTENRVKELKNLGRPGGLHRERTVFSGGIDHGLVASQYITSFYSESHKCSYMWHTYRRKWVSMTWTPLTPLDTGNDLVLQHYANRLVWGMDISIATLYELMPWSWLIDWFSNVGDLVSQSRNTIPVSFGGTCVMDKSITGMKNLTLLNPSGTVSIRPSVKVNRTTLVRRPFSGPVLPEFNLPFLSGRQLSILSAIVAGRS